MELAPTGDPIGAERAYEIGVVDPGERPVFASEDAREGATAFAEKRAPVWRGR